MRTLENKLKKAVRNLFGKEYHPGVLLENHYLVKCADNKNRPVLLLKEFVYYPIKIFEKDKKYAYGVLNCKFQREFMNEIFREKVREGVFKVLKDFEIFDVYSVNNLYLGKEEPHYFLEPSEQSLYWKFIKKEMGLICESLSYFKNGLIIIDSVKGLYVMTKENNSLKIRKLQV